MERVYTGDGHMRGTSLHKSAIILFIVISAVLSYECTPHMTWYSPFPYLVYHMLVHYETTSTICGCDSCNLVLGGGGGNMTNRVYMLTHH